MNHKVVLEWSYEPINFVEYLFPPIKRSDCVIRQNTEILFNYSICIGNGKARIELESQDEYGGDMIEIIHSVLSPILLVRSLETRESYKLGEISEILSNGSRAFLMSTCGQCDQSRATIKDYLIEQKKDEIRSIRLDTRTETLEKKTQRNIEENIELYPEIVAEKHRLEELYLKFHDDDILKIIIEIYGKARETDDATCKMYLFYDIRDTIKEYFKNENTACARLEESNTSKEAIKKHLQPFIAKAIAKAIAFVTAIAITRSIVIAIAITEAIAKPIAKAIVKEQGWTLDESKTDMKKIWNRFGEEEWALGESKTDMKKIWSRVGFLTNATGFGRHAGKIRVGREQILKEKEVEDQKLNLLNELEEHATFLIRLYLNLLEYEKIAKLESHP